MAVHVIAAPVMDPARRINITMAEGLSVEEMVLLALPEITDADRKRTRVTLVTKSGEMVVPEHNWHCVRPRIGVQVVIRIIPGKDSLKAVLMIVVAVAAMALGQFWAAPFAAATGLSTAVAAGVIGMGVTAIGNLLINALIPPESSKKEKPNYAISGFKNSFTPDAPIPVVLGKHRMAPLFAAFSYTEIVGDWQYVRCLFCFGYGELALSDFKIGDTSIDKYDEVEMEVRTGLPDDLPVTLYPQQVIEEPVGTELKRELLRDDSGNIIELGFGFYPPPDDDPVTRFTASDASEVAVILAFPSGLVRVDDKGKKKNRTVLLRIRHRLVGTEDWTEVTTLKLTGKKTQGFHRIHRWPLPVRGRYEIELCRMSNESDDNQVMDTVAWQAIQSFRPEYPLNFDKPLALVAMRVKATHQLNSALDNFNAVAERICPDWDAPTQTWINRATRNPASLYRYALQADCNAVPEPDAAINLEQLQDWHEFCTAKGLKYDRVHDFEASLFDTLKAIAAAGRASPHDDGVRWGVVIDRPRDLVIDHINPRNSWDFRWNRDYMEPPHAFRVPFLDETNDYQAGERIVPWVGHEGEITRTEELQFPGKTDPAEIWREARRRMYELIHRPDVFSAVQEGVARVATRGDLVMGSVDTLDSTQSVARVKAVNDNWISLDNAVVMEAGQTYAIRFTHFADEEDAVGVSVVREVMTLEGEHGAVGLTGTGERPEVGALVHFGRMASESYELIVSGVEAGEEMTSVIKMLAAAPIIDALTDAEEPPAWDGRVGNSIISGTEVPAVPVFAGIVTGIDGTDLPNGLIVRVQPGTGSLAITGSYELRHRLVGAPTWTTATESAASGAFEINTYMKGNEVELQARSISLSGIASDWTVLIPLIIGENDIAIPLPLPSESIVVTGSLGHTVIEFVTANDPAVETVQIYRTAAGVPLNRETDGIGAAVAVSANGTFGRIDGDGTRVNKIVNPEFTTAQNWLLGTDWSIVGGAALKASGTESALRQSKTFAAGKSYRLQFSVIGRTAGNITPQLQGGTTVSGSAVSANGAVSVTLTAITGNNMLAFLASSDFDGAIDDVALYEITPSSLAAGNYDYYLEPFNEDNIAGALSAAYPASVI